MAEQISYFHYVHREGEDSYFKVDFLNRKVIKCCLKSNHRRGSNNKTGIYEIQFIGFHTSYLNWIDIKECEKTKIWHNHPVAWKQLKITTANQYANACIKLLNTYAGNEINKMLDK